MGIRNKKGVFFSVDALIALIIILSVILIAFVPSRHSPQKTEIHYDLINVLSNLKVSEADSPYLNSLVSQGIINETNISVLKSIGEIYVQNVSMARLVASDVLSELNSSANIGLWYGDTLIFSRNSSPIEYAENVETARQLISGIKEGESVTGFSARAYLSSSMASKYYYFGGYVGDGNISLNVNYEGNISSAEIEIAVNKDFNLYINNVPSGNYQKSSSEYTPVKYILPVSNFHSGSNTIEIRGDNIYIAGGFLKISYESSSPFQEQTKYFFPGIDGLVNIYDGFHVPGNLSSMDILLHMNSNYSTFLTIGNATLYKNFTNGESQISLTNSFLSSKLNYTALSRKTSPLRLGLDNVSYYTTGITAIADAVSVTDLSGSMASSCSGSSWFCCLFNGGCGTQALCSSCGGTFINPLGSAKSANKILIDSVLNTTGNRVGLIGYKTSVAVADTHNLSTNNATLKTKVDSWNAEGNTCICCGINSGVSQFTSNSNSSKLKSMVVMSDGEANVKCSLQGTNNAKTDAIQAACRAYNSYNITVHAVGFGSDADEYTLQQIASCGHGDYYFGDIEDLASIYSQIAEKIIEATYEKQTIEATGSIQTKIFPDSYISFDYQKESSPYGLIITSEKKFDNPLEGSFSIPDNSTILSANLISYSGPSWTSEVSINNNTIYNLSRYGSEYIKLGDPYVISIPLEFIEQNNSVKIKTGLSPSNLTYGSASNKIIYSISKEISAYSKISENTEGCIWNIEFEDDTNISSHIPSSYNGEETCSYSSSLEKYNENDATQNAVFDLLKEMDLNSNGKVESKFSEQDLKIDLTEIVGIPYTWSTEVEARTWY